MATATVTSKGQITIPKEIREHLGLEPGDRVVFVVQSERDVVLKPAKTDVRELYGMLQREDRTPLSVVEMDQGVARWLGEKHRPR